MGNEEGRLAGIRTRRYRYILFAIDWTSASASEALIFQHLKRACEARIGQPASELGFRLFDYSIDHAIVRCAQRYRQAVIEILTAMSDIEGRPVRFVSRQTSGTLRSLRRPVRRSP